MAYVYKARNSTKRGSSEMCVETVSSCVDFIRILTRTIVVPNHAGSTLYVVCM